MRKFVAVTLAVVFALYGVSTAQAWVTKARDVKPDTGSFDGHLTSADNTVQKALDTLDDISAGTGDVTGVGTCGSGACLDGSSDGGTTISLYDGNSNKFTIDAPDISSDFTLILPGHSVTMPVTDGSDGQFIKTNASGVWSFASAAGGGTLKIIKEGDVKIGDDDHVGIDFGTGFSLTESPDTEVNVTLDVTPSSGNATLVVTEDSIQVKFNTTDFAEDSNGLLLGASPTIATALLMGSDPADAGTIRMPNAGSIVFEDATEGAITHVDNYGFSFNVDLEAADGNTAFIIRSDNEAADTVELQAMDVDGSYTSLVTLTSHASDPTLTLASTGASTYISSGSTVTIESVVFTGGAISSATTLGMGGALSGATTVELTHTAPTITTIDSDDADGTANLLFATANATRDITATIQVDIADTPTTMITLDGVNSKITFGKYIDGFELSHATQNTITASSGVLSIEGNVIHHTGGTDIADADIESALTITPTLDGDITQTGAAYDWDLIDNNASALSFDATDKAGILAIVTTDASEGITMSGTLGVTGVATVGGITIGSAAILEAELEILDGASVSTTQIDYLSSASGTTGTTSTNVVFSTSPSLTTPTIGSGAVFTGADASPDANGKLVYDSTVTGLDDGAFAYYGGGDTVYYIVASDVLPVTNDHVLAYNSTTDRTYWKADADAGAATKWDDLQAGDANESLDHTTFYTDWDFGDDDHDMFTIWGTAAFGDYSIVRIEQKTGNATDGDVLSLQTADADVDHLVLGVGANETVTHKIVDAGTYTIDVASDATASVAFVDPVSITGAVTNITTLGLSHTAPSITLEDTDDAAGTGNLLFASSQATRDIVATIQVDINNSAVTFLTLDGTNEKITLGKFLDTFEMGHVSDTSIARASAGDVNIEGNIIYRAGGTDVPDGDVADNITITNISQVADISATASEINTPLDGASVQLTEFQELETIGATTISANQWVVLGGIAETLTYTELDTLDGVAATLTAAELNILDGVTGVTAAELSFISEVTGDIQAQIDGLGGDITAVGPGFASGAAFTDGVASTGTSLFVWEGTTVDTVEFIIAGPADPSTADSTVTFREASGTVLISGDTLTGHATATFDTDGSTATTVVDFALNADADAGDVDIKSVDGLYGVDDQIYVDMGTQGKLILAADTTVEILASDEDITFADGGADLINVASNSGTATVDFQTINLATDALDLSEGDISNVGVIKADELEPDAVANGSLIVQGGQTAGNTLKLQVYDVDGTAYVDIITITAVDDAGLTGGTMAIDTSDWNIDATGAITGVALDGDGTGNTITNVKNSAIKWADIDNLADEGALVIADESTDTTCFPLFVTAATGNLAAKSGTNLTFNSSTGELEATIVSVITALYPDSNDDADIGTTALGFNDLFLADGGKIELGNDQDVTILHVADTGILMELDDSIAFGDAAVYIESDADSYLDFVADGAFRFFDAVAGGDPVIQFGAAAAEALIVTVDLGAADQLLDSIEFATATSQVGADDGKFIFDVDGTDILTIDDGGLDITGATELTLANDETITNVSDGYIALSGHLTIPDSGEIGSASDKNAITISSAGVIDITNVTAATAIGTAALTVDGGLGVALDVWIGDDLVLDSDSVVLSFGADNETTLTHVNDLGLQLNLAFSIADDKAITYGGTLAARDWTVIYDEATSNRLEYTHTAGADADVYWDLNDNAADSTYTITNSDGTYEANLVVEGNITSQSTSGDSYLQLTNNTTISPSGNRLYVEGNEWKVSENGAEEVMLTQEDGATLTGTTWSFLGVTNMVLPSAAADASGEISMSTGNQLIWHDGTKAVTIDTTLTNDNYVLKYDNATATFNLEADATGGTPAWEDVTDPTADVNMIHPINVETQFTYTGAFTTGAQFNIEQLTGNPTGGILFQVKAADSDVTLARLGDGTNYTQISQAGNLTLAGTALITAGGVILGDSTPDAAGEIGFVTNAFKFFGANSEDLSINVGTAANTCTITSNTAVSNLDIQIATLTTDAITANGALTGVTTATLTHTAPDITLSDSDDAAGTGNLLFASATSNDIVATIQVDEGGSPVTYITLDGANDLITFGQPVDMNTWALDLSGNTTTLSTIAGTLSDGTASWATATQILDGFAEVHGAAINVGLTNPGDTGVLNLENAAVMAWEDETECTITHVNDTGLLINLALEVDGALNADGIVSLGDGGDNFSVASDGIDIDTSGNITNAGTIGCGKVTSTAAVESSGLFDVTGGTSLTLGSADVTSFILSGISETITITPSADLFTVTSASGVATFDFGTINLATDALDLSGGSITNLAVGGLPDNTVDIGCMADDAISVAELATDAVTMDSVDADGAFTSLTGAWATTGLLSGGVVTKVAAAAYTVGATNAAECYGGVIYVTGAAIITYPTVAAGMHFTIITVGDIAVSGKAGASDLQYLDGTALDDADKVTNTSGTGDLIVVTYYDATGWWTISGSNDGDPWTDDGA